MRIIALSPPGRLPSWSGSYSIVPKVWSTPVADLVPLTVGGAVSVVSSLVMKRDAILSLVHLRHLRLGAWSSGQIRIPCTRGEVRGTRSEVVLRERGGASTDAISVLLGVVIGFMSTRIE